MELDSTRALLYLNHAGTSWPKPPAVLDAASDATRADPDRWPSLFHQSFETVASFFHTDPSQLVLTPGCTSALNLAILDQEWETGDRVASSAFEHHAVSRNLAKLQSQGIDVVQVPPTAGCLLDLEYLEDHLKQGRTKLVAMTAACNVTGALLPFEQTIAMAHQYGAKVLIDGAQIAGWMDLDLVNLGADYFTFAGHKGLQAPWGIGGLYIAEDAIMRCPTAACDFSPESKERFAAKPGYCDAGSVDLIALAGMAAGCRWLSDPENAARLEKARNLAAELTEMIREIPKVKIHHGFAPDLKMPTVAVSIASSNSLVLSKLKDQKVIVSAGFQCAPWAHEQLGTSELGVVRFSFGPTTTDADLNRVISAFESAFESEV